jgi:1-acyl-sn-glycerol-3-phosphate acyltransferase
MKSCAHVLLTIYEYAAFYIGLLLFGLICLAWTPIALVLHPLLPRRFGARVGRAVIMAGFRFFLACLACSGRFRFDLSELDVLRGEKSLIIAANHPSLWDAVLLASRLPNVVCIMKASLVDNLFVGAGARLARYIRNASLRQMVTLSIKDLQDGDQLLLFPEGTRTTCDPIGPFTGSIGVIANRAKTPVQTIFIETDSAFLCKGWPVYRKPELPLCYRIRLGRRFEAPEDGPEFVKELEQYFSNELAGKKAPVAKALPVGRPVTVE